MTNLLTVDIVALLLGLKADSTITSYSAHWHAYLQFAGIGGAYDDADTLVAWRQHLIKETQESPTYINLRLSAVKSIFKELANRKIVKREVAWAMRDVEPIKRNALMKRRRSDFRVRIEPEQMRSMIELPPIELGNPQGARDRALLLVFATSGMRISEVIAVKVSDLRASDSFYMVQNVVGKGQGDARIAPLSREAYLAIQDWLHVRPVHSDWLFTSMGWTSTGDLLYSEEHISRYSAYGIVKRIAREAGLPSIKPHDFRRFVGTQLAKTDIRKAQKALGHRQINTTATHYVLDDVPLGSTEGLF